VTTRRQRLGSVGIYAALAFAIVIALFPFWWMIDTSLKQPVDIFSGVQLWPQHITGSNYHRLFSSYHFGPFLVNSVLIVAASVFVSLVLGTLAAYGLARFRLRFGVDRLALYGVLLVRMLPGILLVVPLYIVLAKWSLLNTRLGLIMIYAGLNTSFVVWMMQSFLEEIPRDIEEAAMVDGDSRLTALRRVVIPLAAPGLIATAIFAVIATYNDFIIALTLTSTPKAQTVPVGVSTLIGKIQIEWGPMAAAGVVGAMPIVLFALVVQRHFVRGLTLGAVK
jgi:multiple sugar transport system permease protein